MWGLRCHVFSLKITIEAMKSDIDEVALQGIEFWSNVCDEEMDLAIEASEVSLGDKTVGLGGRAVPLTGLWGFISFVDMIVLLWESFILTGLSGYLHLYNCLSASQSHL